MNVDTLHEIFEKLTAYLLGEGSKQFHLTQTGKAKLRQYLQKYCELLGVLDTVFSIFRLSWDEFTPEYLPAMRLVAPPPLRRSFLKRRRLDILGRVL